MSLEKELKKEFSKTADQVEDALLEQLQAIIDSAEGLLSRASKEGDKKLTDLQVKAEALLEALQSRVEQGQTNMVSHGKQVVSATNDYVKENPWRAVGIASAIALLVGVLIGRR